MRPGLSVASILSLKQLTAQKELDTMKAAYAMAVYLLRTLSC
jgi:hypothetical protein